MGFDFSFFKRKTLSIGIDLGADTAKLVALLSSKSGHRLVAHALVKKDELYGLKDFLNHPELARSDLRIAIQDPNLKVQKLLLPVVPRDELQQIVSWELGDATGIPIDDYVVRFVTGNIDADTQKQRVTAFAMEKKHLEEWKKFIDISGISHPDAAEPDIQSLANIILYNYDLKETDRYAILDIGKTQSQMAIVSQNGIEFYRPYSGIGGDQLIMNLTHETGNTPQEAELKLLQIANNEHCEQQELITDIVSRYCAQFCVQTQYAFENYMTLQKDKPITNIVLSGGGSQLHGLKEQVQETLHFPTDLIDPFSRLDLGRFKKNDFENSKTLYAVAAGLAL